MKTTALASLVIAFGFTAAAAAEDTVPRDGTNPITFKEVDRNGDGRVNREEADAINAFDFSEADTNGDRMLTRQEFAAAMATSPSRGEDGPFAGDAARQVTFEQADKNQDGKVDADEAEDIDGFDFTGADSDDDRELTRAEFRTAMVESLRRG